MYQRLLVALAILYFTFFATALPVSADTIRWLNADITIHKDSSIEVLETIVYDFRAVPGHGIIRNIPRIKTNSDGKRFLLDIQVQRIVDEAGNNYQYTISQKNNTLSLKIGNPKKTVIDQHTYMVAYRVKGALTYFSDHDEFYWNSTGDQWKVPVEMAQTKVRLPSSARGSQLQGACYTGISGSTDTFCTTSIEGSVMAFATQSVLLPGQGFTIAARFPKGTVDVVEPLPYIPFEKTIRGTILIVAIVLISGWWYTFYPIHIGIKWYFYGRDPETSREVSAWFDPPKGSGGRSLTPAETGALIDETVDTRDILSTIVHMAQRGYFRIEERKKNDFYFVKSEKSSADNIAVFEQTLLSAFFKAGREYRIKGKSLYTTISKVENQIYDSLMKEQFFSKNPQKIRSHYALILGLAFFTMNPLLVVSALIFGWHMPRKTSEGARQAGVGKSLKRFLSSQERTLEHQARTQVLFEKLLPYAIAFGVEKIWAQRFKDIVMVEQSWYVSGSNSHFSSVILSQSLHSSLSQLRTVATPTRSSSGFSSGFSGGSSGGGGGGGGGGRW